MRHNYTWLLGLHIVVHESPILNLLHKRFIVYIFRGG